MHSPLGTSLFRLWGHDLSSEQSNEFNHSLWHEVFQLINSVVLHVADGLIRKVTHSLQAADEGLLELLPQFQELAYYKGGAPSHALTSFIHTRQNVGRRVALIHILGPQ